MENNSPSLLESSCYDLHDCDPFEYKGRIFTNADFQEHKKEYSLNMSRDDLMSLLTNAHPKEIWQGDSLFQLSYRASEDKITYPHDEHDGLKVGDIVVLLLQIRLTGKLPLILKIPVAFKILNIDKVNYEFSFSYIKGNKSKGIQHLKVFEDEGSSIVEHTTRYLSGQSFRDSKLYIPFHEKLLDSFYGVLNLNSL